MKNIKYHYIYLIIIMLSLLFYSCSNELNRNKAKELIIRELQLPKQEVREIKKIYEGKRYADNLGGIIYPQKFNWGRLISDIDKWEAENLKNDGYITFDIKTNIKETTYNDRVTFSINNKAKEYIISEDNEKYELKICELEFGEITGIKIEGERGNKAIVNFTINPTNLTPFGEVKTYFKKPYIDKLTTNHTAIFELYDDGWRITKNSFKIFY